MLKSLFGNSNGAMHVCNCQQIRLIRANLTSLIVLIFSCQTANSCAKNENNFLVLLCAIVTLPIILVHEVLERVLA